MGEQKVSSSDTCLFHLSRRQIVGAESHRHWGVPTFGKRLCYQPYLLTKMFRPISMTKELLLQSLCDRSLQLAKQPETLEAQMQGHRSELMIPLIASAV